MADARWYLLVIGDRQALAWVLSQQRMAFSQRRRTSAEHLRPGDRLFLYTTRSCFKNPTRDRGRVIGEATTTSPVTALDAPVVFGDRDFTAGCSLRLDTLAVAHGGVELSKLVEKMHAFRVPDRWAVYLRRPLVPLDAADATLIRTHLTQVAGPPTAEALDGYRELARVGARS